MTATANTPASSAVHGLSRLDSLEGWLDRFEVVIDDSAEPCDIVEALATFALAVLSNRSTTPTATEPLDGQWVDPD